MKERKMLLLSRYYENTRILLRIIYLYLYQMMCRNVVWINKNQYEINYLFSNEWYKIRIPYRRGPCNSCIIRIFNEKNEDVTQEMRSYMGPHDNWHGLSYRPKDFGYESLTFVLSDGRLVQFEDQMIMNYFL